MEHAQRPTDIHQHLTTLYGLVLALNAKIVMELGVRMGESTVAFLEAVRMTDGLVWSVDTLTCGDAHEMLTKYGIIDRWHFTMSDDIEYGLKVWDRSKKADLIFVDTSHEYAHTKREIEVFEPLVRSGGLMVFHDTTTFPDGVMKPIKEFLAKHPAYKFENHDNCNGLGIMRKP